jgi:hypothetical protein
VPEGWWLAALSFCHPDFRGNLDQAWHAELAGPVSWKEEDGFPEPQFQQGNGAATTHVLAMTAAALRARAHQSEIDL